MTRSMITALALSLLGTLAIDTAPAHAWIDVISTDWTTSGPSSGADRRGSLAGLDLGSGR